MYVRQLATYHAIITRGTSSGVFAPSLPADTFAMNMVALEDAYGLHIVGGNSLITVEAAEKAMKEVAQALGAPTEI